MGMLASDERVSLFQDSRWIANFVYISRCQEACLPDLGSLTVAERIMQKVRFPDGPLCALGHQAQLERSQGGQALGHRVWRWQHQQAVGLQRAQHLLAASDLQAAAGVAEVELLLDPAAEVGAGIDLGSCEKLASGLRIEGLKNHTLSHTGTGIANRAGFVQCLLQNISRSAVTESTAKLNGHGDEMATG